MKTACLLAGGKHAKGAPFCILEKNRDGQKQNVAFCHKKSYTKKQLCELSDFLWRMNDEKSGKSCADASGRLRGGRHTGTICGRAAAGAAAALKNGKE